MFALIFLLVVGNEVVSSAPSGEAFNSLEECQTAGNSFINGLKAPPGKHAVFVCTPINPKKFISK